MAIFNLNKMGFTLLEMMIALLVLMVGMLGLFATIDVSLQNSAQNQLRELAIAVGEEQVRAMMSVPYDGLPTFRATTTATVPYRNSTVPFTVTRTSTPTGSSTDSVKLTIKVQWKLKGVNQVHEVNTVKSR